MRSNGWGDVRKMAWVWGRGEGGDWAGLHDVLHHVHHEFCAHIMKNIIKANLKLTMRSIMTEWSWCTSYLPHATCAWCAKVLIWCLISFTRVHEVVMLELLLTLTFLIHKSLIPLSLIFLTLSCWLYTGTEAADADVNTDVEADFFTMLMSSLLLFHCIALIFDHP